MRNAASFVRSLYEAFGRGEMETGFAELAPTIAWTSHGDAAVLPWAGRREGVGAVRAYFGALADGLAFEAFEPRDFHLCGDTVIALGRTRARHRSGAGGMFDIRWVHVFTLADDRVIRFEEFYDTDAVVRTLTP